MIKQINVIGHLGSSSGLGNAARMYIEVLKKNGYIVAGLDVDYHPERDMPSLPEVEFYDSPEKLPYDVNLVILAIQLLPTIWLHRLPGLLAPRFKNLGLIFWELPVIPPAWVPALRIFDGIIVCSQYVRHAVEIAVPEVKTFFAEYPLPPIELEIDSEITRSELGLRTEEVVFSSSFDLRSDYSRKNPIAVLDAFEKAFPGRPDVRLLIKANGQATGEAGHWVASKIIARVEADPRIRFIAEILPYSKVISLYAAADIYVSLHRAEGLGLGMMEAMYLGKPVIGTGYSGNMTFMSEQNSLPVSYRLVEPKQTGWHYQRRFAGLGAAWAEPDLEAAAKAMQFLYEEAEARLEIGGQGRNDIVRRQRTAWDAPYLEELERWLLNYSVFPRRQVLLRSIALNEFLDPTLRKMNVKAVWSKARNALLKNT